MPYTSKCSRVGCTCLHKLLCLLGLTPCTDHITRMREPSSSCPSSRQPSLLWPEGCVWFRGPRHPRGAPRGPGPRRSHPWAPARPPCPEAPSPPAPQEGTPAAPDWARCSRLRAASPASARHPSRLHLCSRSRGRLPSSLRGAPSGAGCEPPVSLSERRVPPAPSRVRFLPSGSRPSHWAVSAPWGPLPGLRLCPLFLDFRAPGGLSPTLGCGAPGWFRLRSLGPGQGRWGRSGRRP